MSSIILDTGNELPGSDDAPEFVAREGVTGCDLRLMSSVSQVSEVQYDGKNLVLVATVGQVLHFRIFDLDGKMVVDVDERNLAAKAKQIEDLKARLKALRPPHQLSQIEKDQILDDVTSIVGHPPRTYARTPEEDDPEYLSLVAAMDENWPLGEPDGTRIPIKNDSIHTRFPVENDSTWDGPPISGRSFIEDALGTVIGNRYEITALAGTGGMGVVFRAWDRDLDRVVAIKTLGSHFDLHNGEYLDRFMREARIAAQLRHPSIIPVYDVGQSDSRPYVVYQFIEGETLRARLKGSPPDVAEATKMMLEIAVAMAFAHREGVIHRDLKPANILIENGSQRLVVADFGLARRLDGEASITLPGAIMGTINYTSPEQAAGNAHIADARSDVFSLGIMLYELTTGRRPFDFGPNYQRTIHGILTEEPLPPRNLNPAISRQLEAVCLKCLEKDPNRRYQSASELSDDLTRLFTGELVHARRSSRAEKIWRFATSKARAILSLVLASTFIACLASFSYSTRRAALDSEAQLIAAKAVDVIDKRSDELDSEAFNTLRDYYNVRFLDLVRKSMADTTRREPNPVAGFRARSNLNINNIKEELANLDALEKDQAASVYIDRIKTKLRYDLAANHFVVGQYKRALNNLHAIPTDDQILWGRAALLRAQIFSERNQFDEAEEQLRMVLNKIGDEREANSLLGAVYIRRVMSHGVRFLPDGQGHQLPDADRKDLDASVANFERAILSPAILSTFVAPLHEFFPAISLAVARGLRRDPIEEVRKFRSDFEHAYRILDLSIRQRPDGELRDWILATRFRLTETAHQLFQDPLSSEEYELLLNLAEHANVDDTRADCAESLVGIIETTCIQAAFNDQINVIRESRERIEFVLQRFSKALDRPQSAMVKSRCQTVRCRVLSSNCNFELRDTLLRIQPRSQFSADESSNALAREAELDRNIEARRQLIDIKDSHYYIFLGESGQRLLIIARLGSEPKRTEIKAKGQQKLSEAVDHLDKLTNLNMVPHGAKSLISNFKLALERARRE